MSGDAHFTIDTSGTFTMHKRGCAHTKMKGEWAVDLDGPTFDRAGALAAVESMGSFLEDGTTVAFAPCLRGLPGGTHDEIRDPASYAAVYPNRKPRLP